jgi:alpha-galactosidase
MECHVLYVSASSLQAGLLVSTGLAKKGYVYLNMDDMWANVTRNGSGALVPDPTKFPTPMGELVNHVHSLGLKFGIYTDVGTKTCGKRPGSYGHETEDAELFVRNLSLFRSLMCC